MSCPTTRRRSRVRIAGLAFATAATTLVAIVGVGNASGPEGPSQTQIPTTLDDFFLPGTQPNTDPKQFAPIVSSTSCGFCHGDYYDPSVNIDLVDSTPYNGWVATLMAQSARDPVWHAALSIANQDANLAGEYCIRCHAPGAWLAGKSDNGEITDFESDFQFNDFDGVNCHTCHRMVDPTFEDGNPVEDVAIIAALTDPPQDSRGNARFIIDPSDVRRGPYEDIANNPDMNLHGVPVHFSPYHSRSEMCGTCHEVRNPVFIDTDGNGTYEIDALGTPHATQDPLDMYPEQTTYSEWLNSTFNGPGVAFPDGRFGGVKTGPLNSCQDCHMPDTVAGGCFAWDFPPFFERQDLPTHNFLGANSWALRAVRATYDDSETGLSQESVDRSIERNAEFMAAASDTEAFVEGNELRVRVTNFTGHKLPTGYPEGRRIWLNVRFLDAAGDLVAERGAYDFDTAELTEGDTKVYEKKAGLSQDVADASGIPAGESFHLVLNNTRLFDNRIPPMGFTNEAFEAFGGEPIGYSYDDGQYWDDTVYEIPAGASSAVVTLYHQSMTKEYIEWLRDTNVTDDRGQHIYNLWLDPAVGDKVPPVVMDNVTIDIGAGPIAGDADADGDVDFDDLIAVLANFGPCSKGDPCPTDFDGNGDTGFEDILSVLANFGR